MIFKAHPPQGPCGRFAVHRGAGAGRLGAGAAHQQPEHNREKVTLLEQTSNKVQEERTS